VPVDPALVGVGGYRKDSALGPAADLLALPEPPTAIFAANDLSALGVLAVAAQRGLSVPDDLSVIGFDDVPEAASSTPPLTTVRQPIQEMGAAGIDLLVTLMGGQGAPDTHVRLPTTLLVRGTTSPPR
jgi:LacI family transcriptional regulator